VRLCPVRFCPGEVLSVHLFNKCAQIKIKVPKETSKNKLLSKHSFTFAPTIVKHLCTVQIVPQFRGNVYNGAINATLSDIYVPWLEILSIR
jgi:hypothetical protein